MNITNLAATFVAFRSMILRRLRQIEGEHNQMKTAMLNIVERLEAYEIELSKLPDPETTAVDLWLKSGEFDSVGESDDQDEHDF